MRPRSRLSGAVPLACAALLSLPRAGAADEAAYGRLLERVGPAIVSVKVVLKSEFNMGDSVQDQESTLQVRGALVDGGGLVMLWNSQLSANRLLELMAHHGGGDADDMKFKLTPTDFRVTVAGDPRERRAFLAGTDSDLDLAFLQLEAPGETRLPAIEFGSGRRPRIGEEVVTVTRLSPGFDRAAYLSSGRVVGEVAKPRRAYVVEGTVAGLGLPMFALTGEPVGVLVTVLSRVSDDEGPAEDLLGVMNLGQPGPESGPLGVFLLPADRVREVIAEAKKRAAALLAERAAEPAKP
jgi:hypothetical protein